MLLNGSQPCSEALLTTKLGRLHRTPEQVHNDMWDVSRHV
jgi:hypothetical protein